jgi:hypothetical protein
VQRAQNCEVLFGKETGICMAVRLVAVECSCCLLHALVLLTRAGGGDALCEPSSTGLFHTDRLR